MKTPGSGDLEVDVTEDRLDMMAALNAYYESTPRSSIDRRRSGASAPTISAGTGFAESDMTPRQFKAIFVDDNVDEFRAAPHDVVRAVNAIWAVDALVAHIWLWGSENRPHVVPDVSDDKFRDTLCSKCKQYAALRDAANAMKHAKLTRKRPVIHYSTDVQKRGGAFQEDAFQEDVVQLGDVVVHLRDDLVHLVTDIINESLAALESEILRIGAP